LTAPIQSDRAPAGPDRRFLWAVAGLTVLAFAIRASGMHQSLLGDELIAYNDVHGRSLQDAIDAVRGGIELSPPLFFTLAWLTLKIGDPTVWIRLPSLVFGTALVPLVYLLGARAATRQAGLLAAAFAALSPFAIFYANEARPYATLSFFAALSTLCLLRALDSERRGWWVGYAFASAAVIYTHYTGIFVLGTQTLWALWAHRDRLREVVIATAGIVVLYLPWLPFFKRDSDLLKAYGDFDPGFGYLRAPVETLLGHPLIALEDVPGRPALLLAGAAVIVALAYVVVRRRRAASNDSDRRTILLTALALVTPVGMFLAAALSGYNLFIARNMSASLPAALVLLAVLICAAPRRVAVGLAAATVLVFAIGAVQTLSADNRRTPSRDAAALIDDRAAPGDPVVLVAQTNAISFRALDPYYKKPHPERLGDRAGYPAAFREASKTGATVFVVYPNRIASIVVPPPPYKSRYRVVVDRHYPGIAGGTGVRAFAPTG
jgi:hypothetical protein